MPGPGTSGSSVSKGKDDDGTAGSPQEPSKFKLGQKPRPQGDRFQPAPPPRLKIEVPPHLVGKRIAETIRRKLEEESFP
ncbi:hypothetical protein ACM66B_003662 [Microbotryomycetes sp. NB124-2]